MSQEHAKKVLAQVQLLASSIVEVATRAEELEPCSLSLWGAHTLLLASCAAISEKYKVY